MRLWLRLAPVAAAAFLVACGGNDAHQSASPTLALTAPPAQTALIGTPAPAPKAAVAPSGTASAPLSNTPSLAVVAILQQVKLQAKDLPPGFSAGQLEGYQNNQSAASGFDDYDNVVKLMDSTGRQGGLVQGLNVNAGGSAGDSIDVWKDAQGCAQYFNQYPKPTPDIKAAQITLPHPVGDQSLALRLQQNGQIGYSISWRRGRLVLGVGELFPPGQDALDTVLKLVDALDAKAQSVAQ